ncbi:sensor histidine kinase [Leeuwenhoekiella marinoflava]|uniref:sensor histidine kinase n=1 Tax=Leeuwenhoekiella marinoflava TaxID=988 RepID=UPI003003675F
MKLRTPLVQLLFGIVLLSIPFITSPDLQSGLALLSIKPFQYNFFGYFLLLVFFHVNYYVFIPKYYIKRKYWMFAGFLMISYVFITFFPDLFFELPKPNKPGARILPLNGIRPPQGMNPPLNMRPLPPNGNIPKQASLFSFRKSYILQFAIVTGLSLLIRLNEHLKQVQKEKLIAEVSYLKAQINPHFLFNTLNSLYALALRKSDEAPEAILKLSGMMRYVVSESNNTHVPLKKELDYLRDYIALQKLRLSKDVKLQVSIAGSPNNLQIAPLILITYIENAFKYGINPDEDSEINISIVAKDKGIQMNVTNRIVVDKKLIPAISEEGHKNTRQRLDHLYPSKYTLQLDDDGEIYRVNLYIELV